MSLAVKGLSFRHGKEEVFSALEATFPEGTATGMIGPSGTGKTTLLKLLAGLLSPEEGEICYSGKNYANARERTWLPLRAEMGVLFQNDALLDSLTIEQNLGLRLHPLRLTQKAGADFSAEDWLKTVGLSPGVAAKFPSQLSGGMRKRVALVRALLGLPRYLYLDEPTAGLDPANAERVEDLLLNYRSENPETIVVMVSHEWHLLSRLCDQILVIEDGSSKVYSSIEAFREAPGPFGERFLKRQVMP